MPKITYPNRFECPITKQLMLVPVIAADGHTYEEAAIQEWLETQHTSPCTGRRLANKQLTPNYFVIREIDDFREENHICSLKDFMQAVEDGNLEQLDKLNYLESYLHKTCPDSEYTDDTPLHLAVRMGRNDIVQWLLQQGADVEVNNSTLSKPLHYAAAVNNPSITKLLLQWGANIAANNNLGFPPIFSAARQGGPKAATELLEHGASLVGTDPDGNTLLHHAIDFANKPMISFLLQQGVSMKVKNKAGRTPLEFADEQLATFIRMEYQRIKREREVSNNELKQIRSIVEANQQRIQLLVQQQHSDSQQIAELRTKLEELSLQLGSTLQQQSLTSIDVSKTANSVLPVPRKERQSSSVIENTAQTEIETNEHEQGNSSASPRFFRK